MLLPRSTDNKITRLRGLDRVGMFLTLNVFIIFIIFIIITGVVAAVGLSPDPGNCTLGYAFRRSVRSVCATAPQTGCRVDWFASCTPRTVLTSWSVALEGLNPPDIFGSFIHDNR